MIFKLHFMYFYRGFFYQHQGQGGFPYKKISPKKLAKCSQNGIKQKKLKFDEKLFFVSTIFYYIFFYFVDFILRCCMARYVRVQIPTRTRWFSEALFGVSESGSKNIDFFFTKISICFPFDILFFFFLHFSSSSYIYTFRKFQGHFCCITCCTFVVSKLKIY